MNAPDEAKKARWRAKASEKNAIVPHYFEVFPNKVIIECGQCHHRFVRNLIPRLNEPTFACPNDACRARNWVPVRFEID